MVRTDMLADVVRLQEAMYEILFICKCKAETIQAVRRPSVGSLFLADIPHKSRRNPAADMAGYNRQALGVLHDHLQLMQPDACHAAQGLIAASNADTKALSGGQTPHQPTRVGSLHGNSRHVARSRALWVWLALHCCCCRPTSLAAAPHSLLGRRLGGLGPR